MLIRTDCRQYRVTQPCVPHKATGVRCHECSEYDAVREHLLIVKLGAMGDVLRTTICLAGLKEQFPSSHVTWVTRAASAPLLDGNALIDRVLTIDTNYLEHLLTEEFELTIVPEADPLAVAIGALARSHVRRGYASDGRGGVTPLGAAAEAWWQLGLDDGLKRACRRTFGEWLYAICELEPPIGPPTYPLSLAARTAGRARLRTLAPDAARWVCFNTGGGTRWEQKRWNARHYVEFARMLNSRRPESCIVLAGGPAEAEFNRELIAAWPGFVDAGTGNSIEEFAAIIAACDWMLTSDSLGYHLASALGTPALGLVGPTAPWELDQFGRNTVVHAPLDCIACYRPRCPFDTTCMDVLTPALVYERLSQWRPAARSTGTNAASPTRPIPVVLGQMASDAASTGPLEEPC
jgi:heptosyltransferase-2